MAATACGLPKSSGGPDGTRDRRCLSTGYDTQDANGDFIDEHSGDEEADWSAVADRFWDDEIAQVHVPTGVEPSRAAGVPTPTAASDGANAVSAKQACRTTSRSWRRRSLSRRERAAA
jgi:hypothetical protein